LKSIDTVLDADVHVFEDHTAVVMKCCCCSNLEMLQFKTMANTKTLNNFAF